MGSKIRIDNLLHVNGRLMMIVGMLALSNITSRILCLSLYHIIIFQFVKVYYKFKGQWHAAANPAAQMRYNIAAQRFNTPPHNVRRFSSVTVL
jgi:hypothetical protein